MTFKQTPNGRKSEKRVDLILEGGGVKGIALVGALSVLESRGYVPQNIAGTSVGAVVGALLAAGYTATELRHLMLDELDFRQFKDPGLEAQMPLVGKPLNLLCNLGIYRGQAFEEQLTEWLDAKNVRTFGDLRYDGPDAGEKDVYQYKLQVVASDVTTRKMLILPKDAPLLGLRPDRLKVAKAVRMSMSVPIYFEPVLIGGPDGVKHVIVDGGLLSNYPIRLFDSEGDPAWPTFGLHLVNAFQVTGLTDRFPPLKRAVGKSGLALGSYLLSLALTALEGQDWTYIEQADFARTIPIPTLGVGMLDFNIKQARKDALYQAGRDACEKFLSSWDFPGYIAAFRRVKEHSRTKQIAQQIGRTTGQGFVRSN
jgi:NTE family protein